MISAKAVRLDSICPACISSSNSAESATLTRALASWPWITFVRRLSNLIQHLRCNSLYGSLAAASRHRTKQTQPQHKTTISCGQSLFRIDVLHTICWRFRPASFFVYSMAAGHFRLTNTCIQAGQIEMTETPFASVAFV